LWLLVVGALLLLLIGYGAGAVHPYLAYDSLAALHQEGAFAGLDLATVLERYIQALHKGILKVLSKMGISTLQSYRGAQIFEAVGIHPRLIERYFPGTPSRLGGVGLSEIAQDSLAHHAAAWNRERQLPMPLPVGGRYKWRRDGQARQYTPSVVAQLQHAVRSADRALFARYCAGVEEESARARTLRSLLLPLAARPIPLAEVEPARDIAKRFKTGAMSFGSLSPEAHENLAVAMNRLGGRSNSGEGGEDPRRYPPDAQGDSRRSAIKQVASGRFGVTSHYLVEANELQIKIAQGAKPGEGGQLPGHKVVGDIARIRFATPGVGLISPPPHHDIYSIEDLAELIYDLRKANDRARISVKLVSQSGVGTVAAGVAKAGADTILISGHSGGTGASPLSSIKHVGLPWEMGLAETQQVLVHNDLRGRVRLESDGQLKTPRDVFIAALLGAEEFGFGTAALVASGCVLMRVCHLNTCPVGVATQDPVLRARFAGTPEHVMNFFVFLAEGLRQLMAEHGFASVDAMVGRVDRLRPHPHLQDHPKLRTLDLAPLLHQGLAPPSVARRSMRREPHPVPPGLDHTLLELAGPAIDEGLEVKATLAIGNADRAVGTQLSAELSRRWGGAGLHKGHCHFTFQGSAGQSFGAFLTAGLRFDLEGEANDSVGKGLCGGLIVLRPPTGANFAAGEHTLLGNVALYGATGGALFAAGMAGERFAVRNSGATAVVEGVGDHGCEYMTRGIVVVLGPTGRNFAAGMSGGLAYVLDADGGFGIRCNLGLVELAAPTADNVSELAALIRRHASLTGSQKAQAVLADWPRAARDFVVVAPRTQPQASPAAVQAVAHAQAR
ncbi:MAG: glutamate synthase-related protein, partial [Polyangiales bacterium]